MFFFVFFVFFPQQMFFLGFFLFSFLKQARSKTHFFGARLFPQKSSGWEKKHVFFKPNPGPGYAATLSLFSSTFLLADKHPKAGSSREPFFFSIRIITKKKKTAAGLPKKFSRVLASSSDRLARRRQFFLLPKKRALAEHWLIPRPTVATVLTAVGCHCRV